MREIVLARRCYADRDEGRFPNCLKFRRKQLLFWDACSAKEFAYNIVGVLRWDKRLTAVRFSEAGDFRHQQDVDKMTRVFSIVKEKFPDIKIYGYTSRSDLDFKELMKYAVVQGSGFMLSNCFKVVRKIDKSKAYCNDDCRTCNLCQFANGLKIQVLLK